jgi:hypothetical protein
MLVVIGSLSGALLLPNVQIPLWLLLPAGFVLLAGFAYPMIDGTYHLWAAGLAEGWTATDLRKLRKDGWHVVERVDFGDRDVDHVLVGPSGVYAIDTKYTDSQVDLASKRNVKQVREWTNKAYDAARPLRLLLVHQHRIRIDVTPMVVVWGTRVTGEPQMTDGVPVLKGRHLKQQLSACASQSAVSQEEQQAIVAALENFRRVRAEYEQSK